MSRTALIRAIITISFTVIYLAIALFSASVSIYLEVLSSLTIPMGIILGGYFGVESIKNYKSKKQ